jgi:hypothetical protein
MTHKATRALWKKPLFWVLAVVLAFVGAATLVVNSHWFPRFGVSAFDQNKAAALTPQRRAVLESELLREIPSWNWSNPQYPRGDDIAKRGDRWKAMADEGLELAHIALRVLEPEGGHIHSLRQPFERLEELAAQGDVGAMCLMPYLVAASALKHDWRRYQPRYTKWLEVGAQRRHPACTNALGGRLLLGTDGFDRDESRGLTMVVESLRLDDTQSVGQLVLHLQAKPRPSQRDYQALYCLLAVDKAFDRSSEMRLLLDKLSRPPLSDQIPGFANELVRASFNLSDCLDKIQRG